MSPELIGVLGIVALFALLAAGMPIGFAMAIVGFVGFAVLVSPQAALVKAEVSSFDAIAHADLASLPLFLLMAQIMYVAGISNDFYTLAARFIGHWRGGLAMATIGGCAGFGTVSGSSLATAATMGMVALPEMQSRRYSTALATGAVAAGGTLASTVPPSGMLIVYGVLTEQSIGKLFMAGLIPAITQAIFFLLVIVLWCKYRPEAGPPGPRFSWAERFSALKSIGDLMLLLVVVVGGVVAGLFTAVESAAVGALGAVALTAARKRLTWAKFREAVIRALRTSGMIYGVIIGAFLFSYFMAVSRVPSALAVYVGSMDAPPLVIVSCILLLLLVMGIFLDAMAMMTLALPVFYPIILGMDWQGSIAPEFVKLAPIWFGILMVRAQETALITPPLGMNIYVVKGLRNDIALGTVFKGVLPFLIADFPHIALLVAFPILTLYLPSLM